MKKQQVQVEYIPSPSVNRVVPYCMKNFCPTFGRDARNYAKKDKFSCTLLILASIWFTVDIILFGVAYSTNDKKVWLALGLISTIIPACVAFLAALMTACLYCGKIYRDSSEEITLEDHPDLRGSFDQEHEFMNDAFLYDIDRAV